MYEQFLIEYGGNRAADPIMKTFLGNNDNRKSIFASTVRDIIDHNADLSNTWQKGINQFSDITHEEFTQHYGIYKKDQVCTVAPPPGDALTSLKVSVPTSWDWRDFGVVTPVKN